MVYNMTSVLCEHYERSLNRRYLLINTFKSFEGTVCRQYVIDSVFNPRRQSE